MAENQRVQVTEERTLYRRSALSWRKREKYDELNVAHCFELMVKGGLDLWILQVEG